MSDKYVWIEEYKNCSCSFVARKKEDLVGYCTQHFNTPRRIVKLPGDKFQDDRSLGFVGN